MVGQFVLLNFPAIGHGHIVPKDMASLCLHIDFRHVSDQVTKQSNIFWTCCEQSYFLLEHFAPSISCLVNKYQHNPHVAGIISFCIYGALLG